MAETITHTWQTVEQAAVTLNVSTRTIARRLANGTLESRVDENGRRLVLVQQINGESTGEEIAVESNSVDEAVLAMTDGPSVPSSQTITMLAVLQSTITSARDDAQTARRSAKWAWAGVAAMALLLIAGAIIVSSVLTRSSVTTDMLSTQLADTKADLKQAQREASDTRLSEAQAKRELADARKQMDQQKQVVEASVSLQPKYTSVSSPTTQPTIMSRLASLLNGD